MARILAEVAVGVNPIGMDVECLLMLRFICDGDGLFQKILIAETGEDITKALAINWGAKITLGQQITAQLELSTFETDVTAGRATWLTKHPITGDFVALRAIEFRDGTRVEIADDGTPSVTQQLKVV